MPCIYCFLLLIKQNSSSLNCFAFADADFMPKTDVVRGPASAGAKGSALTIHTLFIKGRKELVGAMWIDCVYGNLKYLKLNECHLRSSYFSGFLEPLCQSIVCSAHSFCKVSSYSEGRLRCYKCLTRTLFCPCITIRKQIRKIFQTVVVIAKSFNTAVFFLILWKKMHSWQKVYSFVCITQIGATNCFINFLYFFSYCLDISHLKILNN